MAIADTIQSMYENVGEVYDTITNVDVNNGKNLFDYNKITTSAYYTNNYDGSFTRNSNGSSITINVNDASVPYNTFSLLAGTYSVSFDIKTTATVTLYSFFMCTKQNGTGSNLAKSIGVQIPANTTTHIKAENYVVLNNAEKVGFAGYLSESTGVVISNIQVEKGSTATPYQPYTDNPTYKNIQNIPSTMRNSYLEIMNNGIDKIWNNWEKVTGEGETLTLNSTEEAPMKINLKGNTSQETTTGKNLLDLTNLTTQTSNGITITPTFENGKLLYITTSGTYSQTTYFTLNSNQTITQNTQYIVTGGYSPSARLRIREYDSNDTNLSEYFDQGSGVSFTSKSNVDHINVQIVFYAQNNNAIFYPMVRLSSITDATYEPYTNGPSPNPDYPQDIHVVSGDNSINVCGKNLFDGGDTATTNGITFTKHSDGSYDIVGTATSPAYILNYVPLAESGIVNGETYTISSNQNLTGLEIRIESYNGNTWLRATLGGLITFPKTHSADVTGATHVRFGLFVSSGTTINLKSVKIQLEKGTTDTEYEPHQSASYPISLGNIELCKIGNYQDSIVKDNGKWYLNKQIGKVIFNGSENWQGGSSSSGNVDYTYFYTDDYDNSILPNSLNSYSNKLTSLIGTAMVASTFVNTDTICVGTNSTNRIRLMLLTSRLSEQSTTAFKTWLSSNNVNMYYILSTPTYTEITDSTLLSQLEALNGAKSYTTQTNISQENNDLPFILDVTALKQLTQ